MGSCPCKGIQWNYESDCDNDRSQNELYKDCGYDDYGSSNPEKRGESKAESDYWCLLNVGANSCKDKANKIETEISLNLGAAGWAYQWGWVLQLAVWITLLVGCCKWDQMGGGT